MYALHLQSTAKHQLRVLHLETYERVHDNEKRVLGIILPLYARNPSE